MDPEIATQMEQAQRSDNTAYIARAQQINESIMSKHLDSAEILNHLKNMLMSREYDEEEEEWKPIMLFAGYDEEGKEIKMPQRPLMGERDIMVIINFLKMFLNPNTYLSELKEDRINDIMFDICTKLAGMFYRLRFQLSSDTRLMIWGMIEYSILLGLNRAGNKITLDALSKSMHSIEHLQANPNTPSTKNEAKTFKVLGW